MSILEYTALELAGQIKKKEISCREAVEAVFVQIEKKEKELNCYISLDREEALKQADEVQKKIEDGALTGPLAGVPAAVKDNICTRGRKTTCASKILSDFVPPYDAFAVKKLKEAGCILIGKTNMDEFAMGSTTETSAFGVTRNPWNPAHVPGGSSGGSAAAVAAKEAFLALGSDTGGSIRQPAGFCGVVGMKPTLGAVLCCPARFHSGAAPNQKPCDNRRHSQLKDIPPGPLCIDLFNTLIHTPRLLKQAACARHG